MKHVPQALLILLFVYAAVSKLSDIGEFRSQLYNQTFPHAWADLMVYGLPGLELLAVALMCVPRTVTYGLLLSLGLLLAFTSYIILVKLHYWARVPCSCGGILSRMSWTVHLIFNLIFIVLNLIAIKGEAENLDQSRQK